MGDSGVGKQICTWEFKLNDKLFSDFYSTFSLFFYCSTKYKIVGTIQSEVSITTLRKMHKSRNQNEVRNLLRSVRWLKFISCEHSHCIIIVFIEITFLCRRATGYTRRFRAFKWNGWCMKDWKQLLASQSVRVRILYVLLRSIQMPMAKERVDWLCVSVSVSVYVYCTQRFKTCEQV